MNTLSLNSLVAGRYLLKRPIGGGGMGAVWLAEHVELRAPCAVKLIDREAVRNPDFRRRFTREARAAALLRSAHVVQVLDSGEWRGQPYLVMELLEGEDLRECLLRTSRLPPADCVEIARQIARALTKAHASGIVHRDLKPANVFLTRDDDRLVVKVLDFGIAKYDADLEGTTDSGAVLGTPHYMSPEQCRGAGQVDYRSDLWSLAVIIFECLIGSRPFPGPHLVHLVHQISVADPPLPTSCRPGLPPALDAWWMRAVQRNPAERFASARELVEALACALDIPTWPASSADPAVLAARGPISSAPPSFDPTLPQVRTQATSRWPRTLVGTGTPPPPPPAEESGESRLSITPAPRSSAADLPTKASGIRFANNEPTTRPSAKHAAALLVDPNGGDPTLAINETPAAHTTSAGSLSRTDVKRPGARASEGMRSLGLIALGALGLLVAGGTVSRLAPDGTAAASVPTSVTSAALSGNDAAPVPRLLGTLEPLPPRPPPIAELPPRVGAQGPLVTPLTPSLEAAAPSAAASTPLSSASAPRLAPVLLGQGAPWAPASRPREAPGAGGGAEPARKGSGAESVEGVSKAHRPGPARPTLAGVGAAPAAATELLRGDGSEPDENF